MKQMLRIFLILLVCLSALAGCADSDTGSNSKPPKTTSPTTGSTGSTSTSQNGHTHIFSQWIDVTAASCTQDGLQERACSCGEKETQTIPSPGHIPGNWEVSKVPTATEAGIRQISCLVCYSPLQQEVIPATGTTGLSYQINDDGVTCTVTGIGTCSDTTLAIGPTLDGYTVTAISGWAFENCTNLYSVVIADSVTEISQGAFARCSNLNSITLPNSITTIDSSTFIGCTALTAITIPESVTEISVKAFSGCTNLSAIVMPDSVLHIGEHVFENTAYYNNVSNWENGLLYIGNHLVAAHSAVNGSCTLKPGTRTICDYAFRDCTALTSITAPEGLVSIGSAFYGCTNLSAISLPDSIRHIYAYAFYGTAYYNNAANWENGVLYASNHLVAVSENLSGHCTIKSGTRTICNWAFSSCADLSGITIPDSVTTIGDYAFYGRKNLASVVIPDSVTYLGVQAFYGCNNLASVTLGKGITTIGDYTFFRCYSLTSIIIPDSVTSIGDSAFSDCTNLTSITISDSVTSIGDSAFYRCFSLTDIYFAGTKAQWEVLAVEINCTIHCSDGDLYR